MGWLEDLNPLNNSAWMGITGGKSGSVDLNPFHNSIFTGAGTPWGPMDTGKPDAPQYDTNPENYKGYNSSSLRQALERRMGQGAQKQRAGLLAGLSKSGIRGADTSRGLQDIGAEQNLNMGQMNAGLDQYDYNTRLQEMNAANQAKRDKYLMDYQDYMGEKQNRSGFGNAIISGLLGGAGAYFGGKK